MQSDAVAFKALPVFTVRDDQTKLLVVAKSVMLARQNCARVYPRTVRASRASDEVPVSLCTEV